MQSGRFFLVSFLIFAGLNTWGPAKALAYDFKPLETVVKKSSQRQRFSRCKPCRSLQGQGCFP
jgi:hypothetical protein